MGTRSYTHVYQMPHLGGKCVVSFYRQYDSYLSGYGKELANWLKNVKLTNGWQGGKSYNDAKYYNRSGTMAVALMSSFGDDVVEVVSTNSENKEEFTYHITYDETLEKFKIRVESWYDSANFECYADEFESKIKEIEEEE